MTDPNPMQGAIPNLAMTGQAGAACDLHAAAFGAEDHGTIPVPDGQPIEATPVVADEGRPAAAPLRTCLTFDADGEAAVHWWVSLLPDSRVERVVRPDPAGPALVVEFTLRGAPFMVLNAPIGARHSPAASISVLTADQAETDRLWAALTEGGAGGRCGWVTDRFGVSWQIVPEALPRLLEGSDPVAAARVQAAMMGMGRIDIAALEAAHAGA